MDFNFFNYLKLVFFTLKLRTKLWFFIKRNWSPPKNKWQIGIQTDCDPIISKSNVAVQTFNEDQQNPNTERDEAESNLNSVINNLKSINWRLDFSYNWFRLNNSKPVTKEGEVVSDDIWTAFFEQQRSLLIKILENYENSQVVLNSSPK